MQIKLPDNQEQTWYYSIVTRKGERREGWVNAHSRSGAKARVRHEEDCRIYEWDTLAVDR